MKEVPFVAFESMDVTFNKVNRRLIIVVLVLIIILVVSNAFWVKYLIDNNYKNDVHYRDCPYYTQHGVIEPCHKDD